MTKLRTTRVSATLSSDEGGLQGAFDFSSQEPAVYQVCDLVHQVSQVLEKSFERVWVEGEIDSFKPHSSGYLYFALKDATSCISAVMRRSHAQQVRFAVKNGIKVKVLGRVSLYEPQGKFQLYVEQMQRSGEGALQQALEEIKQRLMQDGLFDAKRKRSLPKFPKRVGIVTSLDGAVLRDILRIALRRGRVSFLVAPCLVQGEAAPAQILAALGRIQHHVDVVIVARGGGSMTDLWAFNDETLARAITSCRVPVVSAIGHEVDYTIADFVADLRAPTPSAAAECVVPDFGTLEAEVEELHQRLLRAGMRAIATMRQTLDGELQKMHKYAQRGVAKQQQTVHGLHQRLLERHPRVQLHRDRAILQKVQFHLIQLGQQQITQRKQNLLQMMGKIDTLSPLQVLGRGYSLVRTPEGHVITQAHFVHPGDLIQIRLFQGSLHCRVEGVETQDS